MKVELLFKNEVINEIIFKPEWKWKLCRHLVHCHYYSLQDIYDPVVTGHAVRAVF